MVQVAGLVGNFSTPNGSFPCEGTKSYPVQLDFSVANGWLCDFTQQFNQKQFTTLQTVYVDNSNNPQPVIITCSGTGQVITAPAMSQGYYSLLQPTPPQLNVASAGAVKVTLQFLNFYIPPTVWLITSTNGQGLPEVDVPALDAVISGGRVLVSSIPGTLIGPQDLSGTIAAGGTAQSLITLNPSRKRWQLSNPSTATEILQFMYVTGASGRTDLAPGQTWVEDGSSTSGDAIFVVAATTGHAFTCFSW
jgi:hypothetical protein